MHIEEKNMDELVALCKRRGFVYPASEIYGGIRGFWDYGPLGTALKNNIRDWWWKCMVECPPIGPDGEPVQIVGLDSSIIQNPKVWEHSGHVGGFNDPMCKCNKCGHFIREDKISGQGTCPLCSSELGKSKPFNLMLDTYLGPTGDAKAYLRPETAQGIFLNFKNVLDTMRVKVPFGIAQIGKSFRNEVTPRNFIFRSREFEQMEMEFFCPPDESQKWYEYWRDVRYKWWLSLGVDEKNLILRDHDDDELAHYSSACVDVEYKYPFTAPGYGELEGVAHRGDYDLKAHTNKDSNAKLDYFDQELQVRLQNEGVDKAKIKRQSRYVPHVIEPASGLTRAVLVLLCEAFTPTPNRRGSKYVMSFKPKFAPIKAGIFPLVNKDGMPEVAQRLYMQLREKYAVEYDGKQSIGKRYARMDEIGTPFCFTIDGDTLTTTVRDRDTLTQERISLDKVESYLIEKLTKRN